MLRAVVIIAQGMAPSDSQVGVAWHTCVPTRFLHNKEVQVSSDKKSRKAAFQFLVATKYKCSLNKEPFPIVKLLDAPYTCDFEWRARIQAAFPECMDKADEFMDILG